MNFQIPPIIISHAEAEGLEQPFTEEEIHAALMGMNGDKAPGPDGFTVAFWQSCSEFAKEEIVDLFKEFFEEKSFAKSLNSTFLVLIPKKGGAEDLGDFRPISLLGGLYKILAKVLANRIKEVLDKVVSSDQNAFVKGRQILAASLIANEVIDYWLKRKEKGLICHAQDGLWGPVDEMDLVVYFQLQVSLFWSMGVPAGYFPNSRGLRQGDPLSPYLFVLGMEVLSALLRRVVDGGFISGSRQDHIAYLSWILVWFEAASGLRINLAKSEVILVGEVEDIEVLVVELGCKVGTLPFVYLGLPLGAKHKTMAMWDGVEARMRRRLALWKRQYFCKRLEKLRRDFLWGGGKHGKKIHLIKWEVVCTQKESGGLGIRKFGILNKALLGKWIWRFAFEEEFLWRKVIGVKYGQVGFGWRTKEARGTFGVGVWRDILKESSWCWDNIEFKVGKGTKVSFWTDHWCGNEVLSQAFPQLFALVAQRNASVNEMWDSSLGQGGWNIRLSRNSNDWELDALGELLHMLRDLRISLEEDSVIWKGGGHGRFRIRDAYKLLTGPLMSLPSRKRAFGWTRSQPKLLFLRGRLLGRRS
ncbi:LINE-1 retrotransposable element ORF2 protein [Vitis vinifera]|uniref:LINE-1 retrotransposable element ORF2 protein n=1 Tax=Vitis vinifera TaxID=29760 RepID=A0A438G0H1_VITVI|nr:LINE-1 retrotransposable element ORF2 protein [Vitis vinifera]